MIGGPHARPLVPPISHVNTAQAQENLMTLNIDGFYRIPKKQAVKKYQLAISSKSKVQQNLLSAAIHTSIYVSALKSGFEYGLIIPGFWVRIPEGPPGFSTGQAICLACLLLKATISASKRPGCLLLDALGLPRGIRRRKFFENCPCITVRVPV